MTILQSIILGLIQGLTEFLPVSSSGHLVIAQSLFGFSEPPVFFDILVHIGTLMSVLVYFRKKILNISQRQIVLIIIGTIPAVVVGLFLNSYIETIFNSLALVAISLIFTSVLLFSTKLIENNKKEKKLDSKKSFLIGLFQALAILPGVSRSGSTIVAGLWTGLKRQSAFNFSFLLAIPAMIGALVLQLPDLSQNSFPIVPGLVGMLVSSISGYISLKMLKNFILKGRLYYFGIYCFALGFLVLLFL